MAEGIIEDDGTRGKDTVKPASISFSTLSFDSSCLTAFRDNKLCCPECYETTNDKSEPEKFDFYVNPDGLHQHFRIQHKNLQVTKGCIIKAKNVTRLVVSSETIGNIRSLSSERQSHLGNTYTRMKVLCIKPQNADLIGREETVYAKSESEAAKLIALYLYHFGELDSVEKRDEAVELLVKSEKKEINYTCWRRFSGRFYLEANFCKLVCILKLVKVIACQYQ